MRRTLHALISTALLTAAIGVATATPAHADTNTTDVIGSAIAFDGHTGATPQTTSKTVTLPLHLGLGPTGLPVGYIITESSSASEAAALGVNYAPKLANALGTPAVQHVTSVLGVVRFAGTVNFAPTRVVVPGTAPNYFPPSTYAPGAVGDALYSPLTSSGNGVVENRPQIFNTTGTNDSVVSINLIRMTVTLSLFGGFYENHPILYIRTESSDPLLSAIESSTYAPNLAAAPGIADDSLATSAREAIVPIVNGPTGSTNPQRQGLDSALAGEGAPLNIIQEEPEPGVVDSRYSPVWDVTPGVWTDTAIANGTRTQLRSIEAAQAQARAGNLTNFGTGPLNPAVDLNAAGFVSLCPVIAVLPIL